MNWPRALPLLCAIGVLAACAPGTAGVGEPVVAGLETPDEELSQYLGSLVATARALPESGRMRGRLGMAYEVNGFLDAARVSYEQAETLAPGDFRWPYFSAQLAAREGDAEDALARLARALAIDADYAPAWLWRGTWLLDLHLASEALAAFQQAAALGAAQEADFGRAQALIAQGKHAEAAELLMPLAERLGHPAVYRALGQTLRVLGRIDDARIALARGSETRPFEWADERQREKTAHARGYASFDLAQKLSSAGRSAEALAIFDRLRQRHPAEQCGRAERFFFACNLLNSSSIAYARADRLPEALQTAQRGLAMNPDFVPFHLSIASHYRQLRDFDAALRHLERAVTLNPHLGHAHVQLGRVLFALGRFDEAKAAFGEALRLAPQQSTTLFYLGMVEAEQKNWPQAIERFGRAVRLDPGLAVGHLYLARSLGEAGRISEARAALREAAALGALESDIAATKRRLSEQESALR